MNLRRFVVGFILVSLIVGVIVWFIPTSADAIYVNGVVRTMNDRSEIVEAFAVKGDRIVGVGTTTSVRRRFRAPREIDLRGKAVLPGLIDAHAHFQSLGLARMTVDLLGSASPDEAARRVSARVATTNQGSWIRGRGWNQNLWASKDFPRKETLDKVAPSNPVILSRVDGHALWVNSAALRIANVDRRTPDPPGGRIVRDARGEPTGVFVDNAEALITGVVPPLSEADAKEALLVAQAECLSLGLTEVQDMGIDSFDIALYRKLIASDELKIRIYGAIGGPGPTWDEFRAKGPEIGTGDHRLTIRAIKLYADGALGSRGAALIEPYSDDPNNRGLTLTAEKDLEEVVRQAVVAGFQVCTHAIGDRGNNIVLNIYERVLKTVPSGDRRLRIEHAQVLEPSDIPRFAALKIIPSMQPSHCTSDMGWAEARLGPARIRGAYAWRALLATGVTIPCGSDFPVEQPDPLRGIYAGITRRDSLGKPMNASDVAKEFQLSSAGIADSAAFVGGWYAGQRMTLDEVLRGYTIWAAKAAFEENEKGSIENGKLADFIILSEPLDESAPERILRTTVDRTVIGGRTVFERQ